MLTSWKEGLWPHVKSRWFNIGQECMRERRRLPLSYIEWSMKAILRLVSEVRSRSMMATAVADTSRVSTGSHSVSDFIKWWMWGSACSCWYVPENEVRRLRDVGSNRAKWMAWILCLDRLRDSKYGWASRKATKGRFSAGSRDLGNQSMQMSPRANFLRAGHLPLTKRRISVGTADKPSIVNSSKWGHRSINMSQILTKTGWSSAECERKLEKMKAYTTTDHWETCRYDFRRTQPRALRKTPSGLENRRAEKFSI